MVINLKNVEEIIFYDKEIWKKMPEMVHLRDQWRISKMAPTLRAMGQRAILDFLRNVKPHHQDLLSEYFKQNVTIDKIENHLIVNKEFLASDDHVDFNIYENFSGFSTYREKDKVKITFWR